MRAVALAAALILAGSAFARDAGVFRRRIEAADGVPLALYRYTPPGGGRAQAPVLLIPDLGFGRRVFDASGFGLAPWLRAQGREVFVLELRGHGGSARAQGWRLEEIVTKDLPAAITAIRRERQEPIELVVQGYSGALVLAATVRELRGEIGRVVALNVPSHVEVPNAYAERLLERGGKLGSLGLDPDGAALFRLLFANHSVISRRRYRELLGSGTFDLGASASKDLLEWMRAGELKLADGSTVRERLREYDRPTLHLLAQRDNWVHPESASPLRELAGRSQMRVHLLNVLQYYREDYSHLSVLQGDGAPAEVFPWILEGLSAPAPRSLVQETAP